MTRQGLSLFLFLLAMLPVSASRQQPTQFTRGMFYHLVPASKNGFVVEYNPRTGEVALARLDGERTEQHWTVSELSGSWRFINPFSNLALRTKGNAVQTGVNNGSDEAQIWKTETDGDALLLIPTNRPDVAAAVTADGKVTLIAKSSAKGNKAARFHIRKATAAGFDDALTYRIRSVKHPDMVLGNGDSGENNARIVGEKADAQNRGQYWNIKMLDLGQRVIT